MAWELATNSIKPASADMCTSSYCYALSSASNSCLVPVGTSPRGIVPKLIVKRGCQ